MASTRVLIVGGSSGMGRGVAKRILNTSEEVIIVGRSGEKLLAAAEALGRPSKLKTIVADATREDDVKRVFEDVGELGHIVSTAADIEGAYELLPSLSIPAAQRAVESKIFAPMLLAKHGAPKLATGGSITYVSGVAAYRPSARGAIVASINAAIEGLVRALAIELGPIRVNAVSPGWVDTPIWRFVAGDKKDETLSAMAKRLPVGRIGSPDDIAEAIAFLMSNGFTTGTVLHVEGGHRLV